MTVNLNVIFSFNTDAEMLVRDISRRVIESRFSDRATFLAAVAEDCREKHGCNVIVAMLPIKCDISIQDERFFALGTWNKQHFGVYGFEYGHFYLPEGSDKSTAADNITWHVASAGLSEEQDGNITFYRRRLGDMLKSPQDLQVYEMMASPKKRFTLTLQGDGNLVLYDTTHPSHSCKGALWATKPAGGGRYPFRLVIKDNGELVLVDSRGKIFWVSGTAGNGTPPYRLMVQDDGNVVLYDNYNTKTWRTNTHCV
ncbi:hypothetical protein Vafri_15083 [Volvox africanus]|nr:hypothetical protein Vafri_15083 [Volvox africanus]